MKKKKDSKKPKKDNTTTSNIHNINWDLIQRMRFMNADAEIDPNDSYSRGERKFNE